MKIHSPPAFLRLTIRLIRVCAHSRGTGILQKCVRFCKAGPEKFPRRILEIFELLWYSLSKLTGTYSLQKRTAYYRLAAHAVREE
uniref:hypothetical protein n=1 Tax=uncultured Oscillibacter sp. TaxID=876091 RepID=UPI00272A8C8F